MVGRGSLTEREKGPDHSLEVEAEKIKKSPPDHPIEVEAEKNKKYKI